VIYNIFLGRGDFHISLRFRFLVCILEDKVVLGFGDFERISFVLRFGDFERTSSVLSFGDFERTGFWSSDMENWIKLQNKNIVSLVY
jgi:hypothetical protein